MKNDSFYARVLGVTAGAGASLCSGTSSLESLGGAGAGAGVGSVQARDLGADIGTM